MGFAKWRRELVSFALREGNILWNLDMVRMSFGTLVTKLAFFPYKIVVFWWHREGRFIYASQGADAVNRQILLLRILLTIQATTAFHPHSLSLILICSSASFFLCIRMSQKKKKNVANAFSSRLIDHFFNRFLFSRHCFPTILFFFGLYSRKYPSLVYQLRRASTSTDLPHQLVV